MDLDVSDQGCLRKMLLYASEDCPIPTVIEVDSAVGVIPLRF